MKAYIDISSVSYVLPIVVGIAVAIGSWVYIHFRRAKSKISKTLGIDENAGKEVEEDIVISDEETDEMSDESENIAVVEENVEEEKKDE
ncbi:MAG: hypothetical protein IKP68_02635 [Clostridia bacterium]|nr:hypothetical protein [Clostridia bacterium]